MVEQTAPFSFGVDFDCASYHPVITADIDLVHYLDVFSDLAPVVRRVDSAIHRINRYPLDNSMVSLVFSDLSSG